MAAPSNKPHTRWSGFSGEQKFGLLLFSITGVVGLILSVVFLLKQIRDPFQIDFDGEAYISLTDRELQEIERQKNEDTDSDGISDYEELNVYRTSAYLADSDGDGFDDGREINSGNDPNCPVDQDCGRGVDSGHNSAVRAADLSTDIPFADAGLSGSIENEEDLKAYLSALSTPQIRAALLQAGVEQETIDGLSDDELRDLFDGALKDLDESGSLTEIVAQ
jgi:hypothetical protein